MLLALACAAFLAGLTWAAVQPLAAASSLGLPSALLGLGGLLARRGAPARARVWATGLGLLALVGLGLSWASVRQPPRHDLLATLMASNPRVVLEAEVASPPTPIGATTHVGLRLDGGDGLTLVDWLDGPAAGLSLGDRVRAEGRLSASNRGYELAFPRLSVLESGNAGPGERLASLRADAVQRIHQRLPEPQAALAAGLLLGGPTPLQPDLRLELQRSGLSHLLAIDGYKQVLIAGALQAVAVRLLGRRLALPVSLVGILGYTLLTGASPSAVRAGLMLALALLAGLLGRLHDPLTGLLLAAAAMGAVQPALVRELAFQLSVAATLGLVLLYPRVRRLVRGLPRPLAEPAGLTLAVTLATLPISLSVFEQVSVVSPLAHVVAVPLVPLVLLGTVLVLVLPPLPWLAGMGWLPTTLLIQVIRVLGSLPGAAISTGHLSPLAAAALACLLIGWGVWELPDARPVRRGLRNRLADSVWLPAVRRPLAIGVAATVSAGLVVLLRPDGRVHITPLPIERGAAWLVRGPGGATALAVRGPIDGRELAATLRTALAVWEQHLDLALVVDPADRASLDGVLRQYPARQVADGAAEAHFDLGQGALLDAPDLLLTYGELNLPLADATQELVTDGRTLWLR